MTTPYLLVPVFNWPSAPGGKLHTYAAGGTTPQGTWSDAAGTAPNANPVVLDTNGTAIVRLTAGLAYHLVLKDSTDTTTLWDADNYQASYLTQSDIGGLLYPRTTAEIAASVTPVNLSYAPGVIDRYGTNTIPGTTDMSAALVAASKCNSYVRGLQGSTYNLASSPVLSVSNFTLDVAGINIVTTGTPLNTVALIQFIPASLVASGRLAGTDYPSNWKNGSTPQPTDGDPNTMMHESTQANRLQNITVIGMNTTAAMTGMWFYSVDGLTLKNCNMACNGWSNVRMAHCTGISIDSSNTFGGSGTYLIFGLKCGLGINVTAHFTTSTLAANGRLLTFKGAFHGYGVSIFGNAASLVDMGANIGGSYQSNLDCVAFDSTPTLTADCNSAAQGGAGTGIIAGPWYGTGTNFKAQNGSYVTTATVTSGHENSTGRAFFMSDPHINTHFDNNQCRNATVSVAGVNGATVRGNQFTGTATGYSIVINPTGNNAATTTANWTVKDNTDTGWTQVSGSSVAACIQVAGVNGKIDGNTAFTPGAGLSFLVANNGGDYLECGYNTIFYSTPTPTSVISSVGTHGFQYNNKIVNTTTGVAAYSEFQGSTTGSVPDGGTVAHFLFGNPSTVVATGSLAGTIVDVTAVSSTNFTVSLKVGGGGAASAQAVYFRARV